MTPCSMPSLDADADGAPDNRILRTSLMIMLDHILWLSQWSVTATSLTSAEIGELEHHLTELDGAVRTVIAHTLPPASRPTRP